MATDATGTPTSPDAIPTYNTSVDAPSGLGFNAAMTAIQTALTSRLGGTVGEINWGGDTRLYRSAANTLATDDMIKITRGTAPTHALQSWVTSEATARFLFHASGDMFWGDGTSAQDTNLYRAGADHLKTDDKFSHPFRGARVNYSAAQSIPHNTATVLLFNNELYDSAEGFHDTGANTERLTAPVTGKYLVLGNISWDTTSAVGHREIAILHNGSALAAVATCTPASSGVAIQHVSAIVSMAATDYVTLRAYQNSGAALNVQSVAGYTPEFMITYLGS